MPIQSMSCPKCGRPASEYSPSKWQCLHCQAKFVYEAPPQVTVQEHRLELQTDGLGYKCVQCGLMFSRMMQPANECTRCHKALCPECFGLNDPIKKKRSSLHARLCMSCSNDAIKKEKAKGCVGCLGILLLLIIGSAITRSCDTETTTSRSGEHVSTSGAMSSASLPLRNTGRAPENTERRIPQQPASGLQQDETKAQSVVRNLEIGKTYQTFVEVYLSKRDQGPMEQTLPADGYFQVSQGPTADGWYEVVVSNGFNDYRMWLDGSSLNMKSLRECGKGENERIIQAQSEAQAEQRLRDEKAQYGIFPHRILNRQDRPSVKLCLDVELLPRGDVRPTVEQLTALANYLYSKFNGSGYERVFICYYLPGMIVGRGAWASSHFNPSLSVEIYGVSQEGYELIAQSPRCPPNAVILGRWLDEQSGLPGAITIVKQANVFTAIRQYSDGSESSSQLVIRKVAGQVRYSDKESDTSDYWFIDSNGNLAWADEEGIWAHSKRIP